MRALWGLTMQSADDLDGIDFKPFFDMVVGILFVLLILIGALLFFQTAANTPPAPSEDQRMSEWRMEMAAFLDLVAGDLQARGLDTKVDTDRTTIVIPLGMIAELDADGLPSVMAKPAKDIGEVLASDLGCVTVASRRTGRCADFRLLTPSRTIAELRLGAIDTPAGLSPTRLLTLLQSQFAAMLYKSTPDLLRLSGIDGGALMEARGTLGTAKAVRLGAVSGDFALRFDFTPPVPAEQGSGRQ